MATILIVDDNAMKRELLVTLLRREGHQILQAVDGVGGLALARAERPQLIVSDVLMPSMDGFEFVRQLRVDETCAGIPVIFYTAYYHDREAQSLADSCGVTQILDSTYTNAEIVAAVNAALFSDIDKRAPPNEQIFDRDHIQVVTNQMSQRADELLTAYTHLEALTELALQLAAELDPGVLLQKVCDGARELTGARYAVLAVATATRDEVPLFSTSGIDFCLIPLEPPQLNAGLLGQVMANRCALRRSTPTGEDRCVGLPHGYPMPRAMLVVPVMSQTTSYGWLCLMDKDGASDFEVGQERLMSILGAQVGRLYEIIRDRQASDERLRLVNLQLERQMTLRNGQLQSVQRDLATILDALPSMIAYWDNHLINRFANRAYAAWHGFTAESLPGMHYRDAIGAKDFESVYPQVQAALRGESVNLERTVAGRNGNEFSHLIVHYVPDVLDGNTLGFYVLSYDVTELTKSKDRLSALVRENEALLSTLHQHALVSIADRQGRIIDANTAFCAISGYTRDELLGQDHRIVGSGIHPRDFWKDLWRHLRNKQPWRGEICNRAKDGSLYWVDSIIAPFVDKDDEVVKYISVRFDITAYKAAQRRLIDSEAFLERVEKVSGVGGFMMDLSSGVQRWTRQSHRILEVEEDCTPTLELVNSFLTSDLRTKLQDAVCIASGAGEDYDIEAPTVTAKGRSIWVRTVGEVECENGVPTRLVGAIHDITERRTMEQKLREAIAVAERASKAKSEFLANMSHEIRTPLNAVIGLGYLLEQTVLSEDQRQFLTKIQFAGRALLSVVNNVLDLSKIEAGEMSLEDEPFDLPELVRDLGQMLTPQAEEKGIELLVRSTPGMPCLIIGDASRLRQILTNLLNNAIKFTETGQVELNVSCAVESPDRGRLRCVVSDTGIGIEAAVLQRLFTPFTQADASTTRRFGGTGLGLSIARRFVDLMGGDIGVTSTVGAGSTFWMEVPLRLSRGVDDTGRARGLQILIADSGRGVPEGVGAMVRALGWAPHMVKTGDELYRVLSATPRNAWPDVLILELHLDDTDAHQLIARVERECADVELPPIIILAHFSESFAEHQLLMRNTDILLMRPLTSSAVFNAITAAVSRRPDSHEHMMRSTHVDERNAQWLAGVRILVVDDSDINLDVARRILEKQGAIVETCSDGRAALEYVRGHHERLDVLLMDVQMPVLDGNEAARRIREDLQLRDLPIVALTAGALVGERQRALDSGMNDFVSKPFDPMVLIRKVRRLAERARGAPIPMLMLNAKATHKGSDRPVMSSIESSVVQRMFGEDVPLFRSVLGRVLQENEDLMRPICMAPDDAGRVSVLKGRAHKLKGSAGMIGAMSVVKFAGALERALEKDQSMDIVDEIARQLASALTLLREEAEPWLKEAAQHDASVSATAATSKRVSAEDIEELCRLLESQNLLAIETFGALSSGLSEILDGEHLERLRGAVDNLDFQLGAELLRAAVSYQGPQAAGAQA